MAGKDIGFNIGVLSLIMFLHVSLMFGVIIPWLHYSMTSLWVLAGVNFIAAMVYVNYTLAWRVNPGTPPPEWVRWVSQNFHFFSDLITLVLGFFAET